MGPQDIDTWNFSIGVGGTGPLYLRVRDKMIDLIRSRTWKPGHMLPKELALADHFGVSIGTIRKAMEELDTRGLLIRQQGRGTFVNDHRATATASFLHHVRKQDGCALDWDPPHTSVSMKTADTREERLFGSSVSPFPLFRFEWLFGASGRRMVLQRTAVPTGLTKLDLTQAQHIDSLDELFDRAQLLLDRTEIEISVVQADAYVADQLNVPTGMALQRFRRRLFDPQGQAIAVSEDWLALGEEVYAYVQARAKA